MTERLLLEEPSFRKAHYIGPSNDQMIEDAHVHQTQGLPEAMRDHLIGRGRLRYCTWVVMYQKDSSRPLLQRNFHNFPWINARAIK